MTPARSRFSSCGFNRFVGDSLQSCHLPNFLDRGSVPVDCGQDSVYKGSLVRRIVEQPPYKQNGCDRDSSDQQKDEVNQRRDRAQAP